jgi:uncharacterized membrane protein
MILKKEIFQSQQFKIYFLLSLMSIFSMTLIVFRLYWVGFIWEDVQHYRDVLFFQNEPTFVFLIWNLFLAWIPLFLSSIIEWLHTRKKHFLLIAPLLFLWLLFFPNAPYILTDLLHLRPRVVIPYWYDIMLISSFAWTGILLGLISLHSIHKVLQSYVPKIIEHGFLVLLLLLCSLGIYIGRFLRWNSWDIFYQPRGLITDLYTIVFYPMDLFPELGIIGLLLCFLYPFYWLINSLLEFRK